MFGVRTSHRSARKPVVGEKRASLREALRNRGGAQAATIVTPAQTDIEDEVDVDMGGDKSAGLDWLNLTAFAPKNLQAVIEKLRADNLPAVVRGQSDNETGKVSSSRPGRADYYSSDGEDSGLDTGRPSLRLSGVLTPKSAAANSSKRKSGIRAALQARGGMQRASVGSAMAATDSDADIPEASAATFELPDQSSAFDGGLPASPSQSPLASSPLPSVEEEEVEAADPEAVGAGVFVEPPNGLAADSTSAQELPAEEAAAEPAAAQEEEQEEAAPAPAETVADSETGAAQEPEAKEDEAASEPEAQEEPPEAPKVPEAEALPEAPDEPEAPPAQEEPATDAPAGSPQQVADAPVADEAKAVDGDASASPVEAAAPPQEAPQAEAPEGDAKEEEKTSIEEKPGDPPPQEPATELAEVAAAEKPAEKPASPQEPAQSEPAKAAPAEEAKPAAVAEAEKPKTAPAAAPAETAASSAPKAKVEEAKSVEAPRVKPSSEPVKTFTKVETITKPEKIQRASTDYKLQHFNKPLPKLPGEDGNPVVPAWKNVKLNNRRHTLATLKEDEVTTDKLSIKDLKQFWGNKNAKGFAGPAIGATSRLSKNEAQATLQRLIAAGGAVDFDEVRRLRKMIAELD